MLGPIRGTPSSGRSGVGLGSTEGGLAVDPTSIQGRFGVGRFGEDPKFWRLLQGRVRTSPTTTGDRPTRRLSLQRSSLSTLWQAQADISVSPAAMRGCLRVSHVSPAGSILRSLVTCCRGRRNKAGTKTNNTRAVNTHTQHKHIRTFARHRTGHRPRRLRSRPSACCACLKRQGLGTTSRAKLQELVLDELLRRATLARQGKLQDLPATPLPTTRHRATASEEPASYPNPHTLRHLVRLVVSLFNPPRRV